MSEVKLVKVDNWGIYFLQRLKHFFNRTDYCDLTLQFQDNAQLKVHRLVLSACTEYFELLERTCEMYEDCLVMPDDLQADVVVPIVNFMYTGQLEFKMDLLERLYQTSEIMSMPVLTKLLDSHRVKNKVPQNVSPVKRFIKRVEYPKEMIKSITPPEIATTPVGKRSYIAAFDTSTIYRDKKVYLPVNKRPLVSNGGRPYREPSPIPLDARFNKKVIEGDPRPTRYELPEELDTDNIFESSFCNISYTSQPLMIHPETRRQYSKRPRLVGEASGSKQLGLSTLDIVECKKTCSKPKEESLFEEPVAGDDVELFPQSMFLDKPEPSKDPSQLFDQMLEKNEEPAKIVIETKNPKSAANFDHAKIISEVLMRYPHLVKSNKNIKLKILNTPNKNIKKQKLSPVQNDELKPALKTERECDYTYETDVIDSKQAAKLIAMGAENVEGPWICLICGTPGKAMNFTSYYKFRRHLVDVHREKPVQNMCEYCGHKSTKRNYLLYHLYTKHGVEPPAKYNFPKCSQCNYVALSEILLVKHKLSHSDGNIRKFRCNVCPTAFSTSKQLLEHIQTTGHKYGSEKKINLQCIYCQKVFMRETNLCSHLKAQHKLEAIRDGIIDDSDDEQQNDSRKSNINVKSEPDQNDYEEIDIKYQIEQTPDGNIHVITKKANTSPAASTTSINPKQIILNTGLHHNTNQTTTQIKTHKNITPKPSAAHTEIVQKINDLPESDSQEEIVMIDNNEYIIQDNQLIPRRQKSVTEEYILGDISPNQTTKNSIEYTSVGHLNAKDNIQQSNVVLKNTGDLNQTIPIPIYVSNEEEYKALMSSNQPIIVDSNDPNKIYSVLTTPHPSALETASINLDNTQSSDMMIIQDEFPLNVSEAVASENSNIVVVYSHQVGDQNKQFQLVTSQGLETQFVQSSTILTQNYETITTSRPIIHSSAEDKQDMWQGNIHQVVNNNDIEMTPITTVQPIAINQIHITNAEQANEHNNDDVSDVPLNSTVTQRTIVHAGNTTATQCEDGISEIQNSNENLNVSIEKHEAIVTQNIPTMKTVEQISILTSGETGETMETISASDTIATTPIVSEAEHEASDIGIQQIESENSDLDSITQTDTEIVNDTMVQCEVINEEMNTQNHEEEVHVSEVVSDITMTIEDQLCDAGSDAAMQTLNQQTSEQENNVLNGNERTPEVKNIINNIPQTNDEPCEEVEESIENIQQEVDKQMNESTSTMEYEENVSNLSQNDPEDVNNATISSHEDSDQEPNIPKEMPKPDPIKAQEKISSLLNDWEDSQEENNSNPENEDTPTESEEITEESQLPKQSEEIPLSNEDDKQDNLKSLVSDWDEDEEEMKD